MRRRLLLALMVAITVSLGAECSGGSSSSSSKTGFANEGVAALTERANAEEPGVPAPEPSAALIFGAGLLAAYVVARKR